MCQETLYVADTEGLHWLLYTYQKTSSAGLMTYNWSVSVCSCTVCCWLRAINCGLCPLHLHPVVSSHSRLHSVQHSVRTDFKYYSTAKFAFLFLTHLIQWQCHTTREEVLQVTRLWRNSHDCNQRPDRKKPESEVKYVLSIRKIHIVLSLKATVSYLKTTVISHKPDKWWSAKACENKYTGSALNTAIKMKIKYRSDFQTGWFICDCMTARNIKQILFLLTQSGAWLLP